MPTFRHTPRPIAFRLAIAALALAIVGKPASARQPPASLRTSAESLVVSTAWLAAHVTDPSVVVIEVVHEPGKRTERIPGSREVSYGAFTVNRDGLDTELPLADSLKALFEGLGISNGTHVVAYADHAPMATRFLLTLFSIGHTNASYLDGGLPAWKAEHRALATTDAPMSRGVLKVTNTPGVTVSADWLASRVGKSGVALIDTRTLGEYNGTGNRSGMPSAGHLAGAERLEWEWLFEADQPLRLKSREALHKLYADRVGGADTVVTYCWVGYRASATWFAARVLGLDSKLYDGSYQDWKLRQLPVTAGEKP